MEANILYPPSRQHSNCFGEYTQITYANVSSSCSCQFCRTKSRLTNPTHSPSAVSKRTNTSLPSALPSLQCSAFISILSSCALKNPYHCGLFCIWPLSPTTTTTPSSPTLDGEMLLSMCLFREKWPFVSAAPRHRRSRRLTPAE